VEISQVAAFSDYSLEFAHVEVTGGRFDVDSVERSAQLARLKLDEIEGRGQTCSVCILVDDKEEPADLGERGLKRLKQVVTGSFPRVDYICFEKSLARHVDALYTNLRAEKRQRVRSGIARYRAAHGHLGCSHDIAIWQMMRFGWIENTVPQGIINVRWGEVRGGSSPFVAKSLISVLSRGDARFEKKALDDILCYSVDAKAIARIERIYY
jgi:hypothetical protein